MFERGNPYKYTDPTGHIVFADDVVVGFTVIIIVVAILTAMVIGPMQVNEAELTSNTDVEQSYNYQTEGWSNWEYKKFRDDKYKWVRENEDEIETWEIDPGLEHEEEHINNRIYRKDDFARRDNWQPGDGPKPPVNPRDGPDNHKKADPEHRTPNSYREAVKKEQASWWKKFIDEVWSNR